MTDQQFQAWLESDDAYRCTLVEAVAQVAGVETTRYMSTVGYTTSATDNPPNRNYDSVIVGGCTVSKSLGIDGQSSLTVGDIEIANVNGELSSWLDDVWSNRVVNIYVGDMRWPRADFRHVFSGIIKDLSSRQRNTLNLEIRDKMQRLNTAVSETLLGGTTSNSERFVPVMLGENHNVEPLQIDPATLKYKYHKFASERLIEIRDEGVPVLLFTSNLADSTFTLGVQPAGRVTISAQGDVSGGYMNTVSRIVQRLAMMSPTDPFTADDLDAANLAAFDAANPQPIGVYINDRENVINVAQQVAASVGAQPVMSALNRLQLIKVELPAPGVVTQVSPWNMVDKSIDLVERLPVRAGVTIGYCKNWAVQKDLQTGIPVEHADLFGQEWLTASSSDGPTATKYKITDKIVQENTFLLRKADALAEATRRRLLWGVPRFIFQYRAYAEMMLQEVGGAQFITHSLYNFGAGKNAQVVSIEKDWFHFRATIQVLV